MDYFKAENATKLDHLHCAAIQTNGLGTAVAIPEPSVLAARSTSFFFFLRQPATTFVTRLTPLSSERSGYHLGALQEKIRGTGRQGLQSLLLCQMSYGRVKSARLDLNQLPTKWRSNPNCLHHPKTEICFMH
jgi:hypothetical protein